MITQMKIQLFSPLVLTVRNIGDVMYGPMPITIDTLEAITAVNNVYRQECRKFDNAVLRMEKKLG